MIEYRFKADLVNDFRKDSFLAAFYGSLFYVSAVLTLLSYAAPVIPVSNDVKALLNAGGGCCKFIELLSTVSLYELTASHNKEAIKTVNEINKFKYLIFK
jgi:hypothetical protein